MLPMVVMVTSHDYWWCKFSYSHAAFWWVGKSIATTKEAIKLHYNLIEWLLRHQDKERTNDD